jgi:hypothetical protein
MVAKRIVDVLEVIEVDIEDGGRRGADAYFLDHRFQALAEIDAVGQSAKRVMHGEMAQARFAGRNSRRRPTHVAKHEGGKQREADGRDRDEWHNVLHPMTLPSGSLTSKVRSPTGGDS